MTARALLALNSRAGGRARESALRRAVQALERGYHVTISAPPTRDELSQAVRETDAELVIAGGGDGTVNAVVAALPQHAALGILPLGTANDFARDLGVPHDPVTAAERLVETREIPPRHVDLVTVNGRPFCTVGGIGLVARTAMAVTRLKERGPVGRSLSQAFGPGIYRLVAGATILTGPTAAGSVTIAFTAPEGGTRVWQGRAHAIFVVNHRLCGGGLAVPTRSSGSDGVFEIGIVTASSRPGLVWNFSRLSSGAPIPAEAFEVLRATEARLQLETDTPFVADGEVLAAAGDLTLVVQPGALAVRGAIQSRQAGH